MSHVPCVLLLFLLHSFNTIEAAVGPQLVTFEWNVVVWIPSQDGLDPKLRNRRDSINSSYKIIRLALNSSTKIN